MAFPNIDYPDPMNLRLAALYADVSEMRIRALLREGKIKAAKDAEGRWSVTKADLDAYRATKGTRKASGERAEGKAWVIHVKAVNFDAVTKALAPLGIKLEPRYDYEKQKAYRSERAKKIKAAKAAEKAAKGVAAPAIKAPAK
jgi:hypothetical protein